MNKIPNVSALERHAKALVKRGKISAARRLATRLGVIVYAIDEAVGRSAARTPDPRQVQANFKRDLIVYLAWRHPEWTSIHMGLIAGVSQATAYRYMKEAHDEPLPAPTD